MRQGANGTALKAWKIAIRPLWKVSTERKPATKPTTRRVGVIGGSRSAYAPDQPGVPRLLSPFYRPCQTTGEAWWPRRSDHARVALEERDGPLPGESGGLGRVALLAGVVVEDVVRALVHVECRAWRWRSCSAWRWAPCSAGGGCWRNAHRDDAGRT